ncbi:hypothetical protein D3C79_857690 [compost metagenome]
MTGQPGNHCEVACNQLQARIDPVVQLVCSAEVQLWRPHDQPGKLSPLPAAIMDGKCIIERRLKALQAIALKKPLLQLQIQGSFAHAKDRTPAQR